MQCKICGQEGGHKSFEVREMMFGLREHFAYFQCARCSCLQIAEIPADMGRYYPPTYYSLTQSPNGRTKNPVFKLIKRLRDEYAISNQGIIGRLLHRRFPNEHLRSLAQVETLSKDSKILDVGCGTGLRLHDLKEMGFANVLGIDPFIAEEIEYTNGLKILKKSIHELQQGEWDVIMLHHVLEHMPDPLRVLQSVARLLSPAGICIIRTPTVSSFAWEHYGVDWVQLDAPRHFFIHSMASMARLAQQAKMKLAKTAFDSCDFQFWGSEQCRKDVPLMSERSYFLNRSSVIFSRAQIADFKKEGERLNAEGRGDSAVFYLSRI